MPPVECGRAPGGQPGPVITPLRRAPPAAVVTASATSGAGTGAGCRLTPTLPGSPGSSGEVPTGRSDRCHWRGTCQPRGFRRGGWRRDVGQGPCEGAPWGVGGCAVCAACAPPGGTGCVCVSSVRCAPPSASTPARCQRVLAALDPVDAPRSWPPFPRLPLPPASSRWMRKALTLLLLLLVSGVPAAPQGRGHRPEDPAAMRLDPDFDLLSPELPTLLLLQRTVQSLAMPEQDVEALTREQVLLYLFVLHDHDRNGHLDGLELLQLLSTVLAQRNGGQPHLDMVAVLVDQALERQDVSRDGLLNPPELLLDPPKQLLSPGQGQGAPGPPLLPHPREPEVLGGNMGVNGPGLGPAEKQEEGQEALQAEIPQAESPDGGLMEVEDTLKIEAPEAEVPKAEAAPVWGNPREG